MTNFNQRSVCYLLLLLCCSRSDRWFPECGTLPQLHMGTYLWDTQFFCPRPGIPLPRVTQPAPALVKSDKDQYPVWALSGTTG